MWKYTATEKKPSIYKLKMQMKWLRPFSPNRTGNMQARSYVAKPFPFCQNLHKIQTSYTRNIVCMFVFILFFRCFIRFSISSLYNR